MPQVVELLGWGGSERGLDMLSMCQLKTIRAPFVLIAAIFRGRIDLSHYGASNSAILSLRQAVSADQGPCLTISS